MTDEALKRLADMESFAELARKLLGSMTLREFSKDDRTRYAVQYALLLVGEASIQVPNELKSRLLDVPWAELKGLRNRLAHAYFTVDVETVYLVVSRDLPHLLRALQRAKI